MSLSKPPGPFEISQTCLCFQTQKAARVLARRFDAAFRPLGLTNGQFSLMTMLSSGDQLRMGEIAAFLAMDRTTLTAAIKAIERAGLASVRVDPQDRRGRLVALTASGRDVLEAAKRIWRKEHARLERETVGLDAPKLRKLLNTIG